MENELKEGFLHRLREQGPQEGWIVRWHPHTAIEGGSFFSASPEWIESFIKRKLTDRVTITIEPHTRTYDK